MLKADGNRLVTMSGGAVHLHGVNIPSMEWSQGEHLTDSLDTAVEWGANIVRLPLNQDRWFGRTWERQDEGAHYRKTVSDFLTKAAAAKCYVVLDLHWSDCGVWGRNVAQHKMPDDNSVAFWESVAETYANVPAVLFSLYNEPHDVSWEVWRDGGAVSEASRANTDVKLEYHTPGMQKLLEACRTKGARNVVVAGGLDWAYDLRGIVGGHALSDTNGNGVAYDTHTYPMKKWYTHGDTKSQDWDRIIMVTGEKYPVIIGEFGDGPDNYTGKVLDFARQHQLPWIAWSLHTTARPTLIRDWNYTPTDYGVLVKQALQDAAGKR